MYLLELIELINNLNEKIESLEELGIGKCTPPEEPCSFILKPNPDFFKIYDKFSESYGGKYKKNSCNEDGARLIRTITDDELNEKFNSNVFSGHCEISFE